MSFVKLGSEITGYASKRVPDKTQRRGPCLRLTGREMSKVLWSVWQLLRSNYMDRIVDGRYMAVGFVIIYPYVVHKGSFLIHGLAFANHLTQVGPFFHSAYLHICCDKNPLTIYLFIY